MGGAGRIIVDGNTHEVGNKEALYLGSGDRDVVFDSVDANKPAKFYINSAPAPQNLPTVKVNFEDAEELLFGRC